MSDNNSSIPLRTCTKCGIEYPATTEHFYKNKSGLYGLMATCKLCMIERSREWRSNNREYHRELSRKWHHSNPDKVKIKRDRWHNANLEYHKAAVRTWIHSHPDRSHVYTQRRRARKQALPNTLTTEQKQHAVEYFNGCCAVCGRQCDLFGTHTLAMDHWIPLSSPNCPGTIATNMIPLCHGEGGCNNSKRSKDAEKWLVGKFGKRKATTIIKRIREYIESVK